MQDFTGTLYTPESKEYDELRLAWNRNVDPRPEIIYEPLTSQDVQLAVRDAANRGLGISVQSTGHGMLSSQANGALILMHKLNAISVDANNHTVRTVAGAVWADVVAQTAPYNMAPISGTYPGVGVAGYTLGGGHGWLSREHGVASNSLIEVELVTADGELLTVNETEQPELMWGLRGGSGNFGVVTALTFKVYPLTQAYAGKVYFDVANSQAILKAFRDLAPTWPDTFTGILTFVQLPPIEQIPEPIRGKRVIELGVMFDGSAGDGEQIVAAFLERAGEPLMNGLGEMTYEAFMKLAPQLRPGKSMAHTRFYNVALPEDAIAAITEAAQGEVGMPIVEIRALGGAYEEALDQGAASYGGLKFMASVRFTLKGDDSARDELFKNLSRVLDVDATAQTALNVLSDQSEVPQAFTPDLLLRLRLLKQTYDPQNIFRFGYELGN